MSRVAPNVPADSDLLCERCGYTLSGLPAGSNCPECGLAASERIDSQRQAPAWEMRRSFAAFVATSAAVIFKPTHFYRTFTTRGDAGGGERFALYHHVLASVLLGVAGYVHADWYNRFLYTLWTGGPLTNAVAAVGYVAVVFALLRGVTALAARLTNWEATYRGIRLRLPVVRRGLAFHSAHYLPVGFVAVVTVVGYRIAFACEWVDQGTSLTKYLWTLSGEVVVGAAYLFNTYWIGMRNMMYANR